MGGSRRWGLPLFKALFTALLLTLVLRRVGLQAMRASLSSVQPAYLVAALILSGLSHLLKGAKWYLLVRCEASRCGFGSGLGSYLAGMGLALVTPGRFGELGRTLVLPGCDRLRGLGLAGLDKLLDLAAVLALAGAGGFAVLGQGYGLTLALLALLILWFLYRPHRACVALRNLLSKRPALRRFASVTDAIQALPRRVLNAALALTLGALMLMLVEFYVLVLALEPVSFRAVSFTYPLVMLGNALPITIGGLGVREGAAALLLARFGVSEAAAVNAAFLIFLFNLLLPGLLGAAIILRHRGGSG